MIAPASAAVETRSAPARPVVAVVAFQSGKRANGGLESLFEIARRLERVRPLLVTQRESEYTERWRAAGLEVHVWPLPDVARASRLRRALRNVPLLMLNRRLSALLRDRGVRVVHCNDGSAMAMAGLGARQAGAKIVLNLRDTSIGNRTKWRAYRLLAHEFIVLSREMREFAARELSLPAPLERRAAPIASIYSIVDLERMSPLPDPARAELRSRLGIAPSAFAVGVVGAFVPKKRQLDLLRHLASSPPHPALHFYFVGDFDPARDAYAAECQRVIAASPTLERQVHLLGFSDDPASYYRAVDLTLLPSKAEGLARSTIESLACATPVVAFDFCSAREILEGHAAGLVVAQGDFSGLLAAVERLRADPALRRGLGEAGCAAARRLFGAAEAVKAYEEVYLRLAARDD